MAKEVTNYVLTTIVNDESDDPNDRYFVKAIKINADESFSIVPIYGDKAREIYQRIVVEFPD